MKIAKPIEMFDMMKEVYLYYKYANQENFKSGIDPLDDYIPFYKGQINLFGARAGAGKTRLALRLIDNYAIQRQDKEKKRVCYFSMEDTELNLSMRFIESRLRGAIRHRQMMAKEAGSFETIDDEVKFLSGIDNFRFYQVSSFSLEEILATFKSALNVFSPNVFIFDYLQAIQCPGDTYEKHSRIAESIRAFVNDTKVLFFGLVQLNRGQDDTDTDDKAPSMAGITGSGVYEQIANSITLLKRQQIKRNNIYVPTDNIQFYIRKNRDGGGRLGTFVTNEQYEEVDSIVPIVSDIPKYSRF